MADSDESEPCQASDRPGHPPSSSSLHRADTQTTSQNGNIDFDRAAVVNSAAEPGVILQSNDTQASCESERKRKAPNLEEDDKESIKKRSTGFHYTHKL